MSEIEKIDVSGLKWVESITVTELTTRELIPNKISETTEEFISNLENLVPSEDLEENEKVLKLMDYILEQIYFSPEKREKEFQELKRKKEENPESVTHEEITEFLERENNMDISGEDWQKLIHCTGLLKWSMWEMWNDIKDRIKQISKISYFSMNATLRTWIHTGLFLQNIAKYFPDIKNEVFDNFKNNQNYSGMLALTSLGSWSDLFENVWIDYEENEEDWTFHLKWEVHFQWLTDEASHWIVLAKNKNNSKEFKVFFVDTTKKNQSIEMSEEYNMEMLDSITYWKNEIDAIVLKENVSKMRVTRELPWMLNDSRMQFPAMTVWAMKRIEDETRYKIELREIAWWKMIENRTIKDRFLEIGIRHNIVDILNKYLVFTKRDLSNKNNNIVLPNISKAISTDYILDSARSAKILQWWDWFKNDNLISNIWKDSWPFAIFEWNNDMLYSQIVREYKNKIELNWKMPFIWIGIENIKDLDLNNSMKWQIYAKLNIISMINEMWLRKEYKKEIEFLTEEIHQTIIKAKNVQPDFYLVKSDKQIIW